MAEGMSLKPASALSWSEVASRESSLVQRCAQGDELACAELVDEHQRMVYTLALHLLGDHDEALEVSQEVFLRVFRTTHAFRGQSALRPWISRFVINQARNRQRWWRRRFRAQQVSLDEHIRENGEMQSADTVDPDRVLGRKELASRLSSALDGLPFDQLVLAKGARVDAGATPGLAEAGDSFYTEAAALQLHAKLRELREGRVVVSVIGVPHMCPVAPLEITFMLDDWLRRRGVRDAVEITYTYPINRTHSIPQVAEWATPELERRGVRLETFFNAEAVDPARKVLTSMEGTELPFDVLIAIPEHRSAPFLEASGLTQSGWVPTMRDTLAVKGQEGIWALGDTTDLPVSKAGSVAHYQAGVIAHNVAARVRGEGPVASYEGKTICFIEAGLERATFLEFDYRRPPALKPPTKLIHWAKLAYNNAYWLTAKGVV